jgi:FkbM family methyltransferase
MKNEDFYILLINEILENISNQYDDNYNHERFGIKQKKHTWKSFIKSFIKKKLHIKEIVHLDTIQYSFTQLIPYFNGIVDLYKTLSDENSKRLLIQLIAYRILGYEKYKLPLSTPDLWKDIEEVNKLKSKDNYIKVKFPENDILLYQFNLKRLNIPIEIYLTTGGIHSHLKIKQYEYISEDVNIKVENDDIVLDCGACWGDTALFFANEISEKGHIYSFEFIPGNTTVFNQNINLNPNLKEKITLVLHPLDEVSGKKLYYIDNGPASKVFSQYIPASEMTETTNIDDFFNKYELPKIDFIKMDIEGAELPALKGGIETIKRFRPKLAISIYHSMDDFVNIAEYIKSLNLGYKFYLKHGTIHGEETVLFATSTK